MTDRDRANLMWAVRCNNEGIGFLGPSLKKYGPVQECEDLVRRGLLSAVREGSREEMGYWITDAGRAAIAPRSR